MIIVVASSKFVAFGAWATIKKHKVKKTFRCSQKEVQVPNCIGTTLCLPPRPPVSQCLQIEKQTRQPTAGTHTSFGDGGSRKQCLSAICKYHVNHG